MRVTWFFSLFSFFVAASLSCAILEIDSPSIDTLSPAAIAAKCGGPNFEACTALVTEVTSSCVSSGDEWRAVSTAHVTPHVFTSRSELLRHEFLHIADVRGSLRKMASDIERRQFASQDSCLSFVATIDAALPRTLRNIEKESARRRDPPMASAAPQTASNEQMPSGL